ncbi:MAG TPA: VWA domain-containing protein [Bryobacteraceae bacterium]|nr:VWA domain-containing protein [Bryobacteraceae bacterium]
MGRCLSALLFVFALCVPAGAQPAAAVEPAAPNAAPNQEPFRINVREVIVPVTVTDIKGRFVSDLEAKDFHIFDEGKEQKIQFFTRNRQQPVVVGFLLDLSNASKIHWKTYQESAIELISTLLPNDPRFSGYLITYATEAEVAVDTTTDSEKLIDKVRKLKPGGGAALYDAIWMACTSRKLVKGEPFEPRRVIVVIGDGHDNASKKTLNEVLEIAQRNLVTVYGVSTVAFGFNSDGEKNLTKLAEETGGRVEYPLEGVYKDVIGYLEKPSDEGNYALKVGTGGYASQIAQGMFRAIANVAGEVTTQYIIRYTPDTPEEQKTFRNIKITVPDLPNVKVRTRKGYYPEAASHTPPKG